MLTMQHLLPPLLYLLSGNFAASTGKDGQPASVSEYAYIVGLYAHSDNIVDTHPRAAPVCTGLLLPKKVIVTAASCVHDMDDEHARVAIGHGPNMTIHPWERVSWPGQYNRQRYRHDIAAIIFRGTHHVTNFAKLSADEVREGQLLTMITPGPMTKAGDAELRQTQLPVINHAACHRQLKTILSIKDKFCTEASFSSCAHAKKPATAYSVAYAGSPILRNGAVVGIASVGAADEAQGCHPLAFTIIKSHLSFLAQFYDREEPHDEDKA
ncbi:hypothetical protein E4U56_006066 [Claviceps arundinis]|uniref:Peptidase S1 domain-containing protein n=1 Tax=Claviceps arundinis TaxID=1623583 RepID=A0A9P7MXM4_9HYPO|nr:hypothetical protein E4U56_006066 [Claviceps arundinis]